MIRIAPTELTEAERAALDYLSNTRAEGGPPKITAYTLSRFYADRADKPNWVYVSPKRYSLPAGKMLRRLWLKGWLIIVAHNSVTGTPAYELTDTEGPAE